MEILVTQKKGEKYNNNLIKDAINFFARTLLKKKHLNKIGKIRLSLVKEFDVAGECYDYRSEDGLFIFDMKVDRETSFPDIISTIAHEMIHVNQIVIGNLVITDKSEWFWCGKSYGTNPYDGLDQFQQQDNLPWEREAYHNEAKLSIKFFEFYYTNLS